MKQSEFDRWFREQFGPDPLGPDKIPALENAVSEGNRAQRKLNAHERYILEYQAARFTWQAKEGK